MPEIDSGSLQINQSIEAAAPDTTLTITINPDQPLRVGTHVFQLEVIDDSGNRSQPAQFRLTVFDDQAPTAVITGPDGVPFNREFALSGQRSTDVGGGTIETYIWTLVG